MLTSVLLQEKFKAVWKKNNLDQGIFTMFINLIHQKRGPVTMDIEIGVILNFFIFLINV